MATEIKQTWGRRSKHTSVVALGLVAVLAGVAVAYFLTRERFGDNRALGGTLTVDSTLPVDFTGHALYPTNTAANAPADSSAVAADEFTITNNNTVNATYSIFATCEECIEDPDEVAACTATGNPKSAECQAVQRRKDKDAQFKQLYVKISRIVPPGQLPGELGGGDDPLKPERSEQKYAGRLADMTPDNPKDLGMIDPTVTAQYDVELWLANDPANAQPQGVENDWEFFINAKTPVG